jgi:uncharacterized membrane protein
MGWFELAAAMALFLVSHRIPAMLGLREALIRRLGPAGYVAVFSVVSLALLWWLIVAAARAPYVGLWETGDWQRWLVNLVMPLAIALTVFGTAAPNPFAFEGRAAGFNPDRPGIAGLTRQPLLWALALWSGAHLAANGDVAHVILFGTFLALAVAGMPIVERRRRRTMGGVEWARLAAHTGLVPFAALADGRWRPRGPPPPGRTLAALAIWAAVWHLHAPVIGVWPGP